MYEKALGRFADAYCIQSRLALRYSELRDFAKAAEHYERAFELMPESFGRIESHCFGCEGAFNGEQAQGIAERVFTRLAERCRTSRRYFTSLGYLRQMQGNATEAAAQFRQAVKLDPDYFNAWSHLLEVSADTALPQEELDAAILALLRLDPAMRHQNAGFERIGNLRSFWEGILAAEKARPRISSGSIYPLAASKITIENRIKAARKTGDSTLGAQTAELMAAGQPEQHDLRALFVQSIVGYLIPFLEGNGME